MVRYLETREIIEKWNFPKATIINRNLPKSQIFLHIKKSTDKKFIQDAVQSVYLLANFKTSNTNIPVYKDEQKIYEEIQFFYVKTKNINNPLKIYKILSFLIPYPLVVIMRNLDKYTINTGEFQRLPSGKLKLINIYSSPKYSESDFNCVLQKLVLKDLPNNNFKEFYDGLCNQVVTLEAREHYSKRLNTITREEKDQLDDLSSQIEKLRTKIKREHQINRKIDMQMKLTALKKVFLNKFNNIANEKKGKNKS